MAFKLQASGISGNLYNLIFDYLAGRKQYVEIEGQRSIEAKLGLVFPKARYWALGYLVYISMICLRFLAVEIWKCLPIIQPFIVLEIQWMVSVLRFNHR